MGDPYVYLHTDILKNLANIQNEKELSCMEAEYTSLRLAELVTKESASHFDFVTLCDMHYYIFQDIYEWAGKIRVINIEKSEPALGGIIKIFGRTLESTSVSRREYSYDLTFVYWNRWKHRESDVEEVKVYLLILC